jgi:hypothetical protein
MYRANYSVDNPSDYWKISLYLVFLCHLVDEISKLVISNERHWLFRKKNCWDLLIWVTGHCNRAAVSRNRSGVEKTVDTHKILINAIMNDIVYIDHMKIADVPASPSLICKWAKYPSFLAMLISNEIHQLVNNLKIMIH